MSKRSIIFFNILIIISLLTFIDYFIAKNEYKNQIKQTYASMQKHKDSAIKKQNFRAFSYNLSLIPFDEFWDVASYKFRKPRRRVIGNGKKKSIILFGCSFIEGSFLEDDQILSYKLSTATGRTVYNRGFQGFGPAPMLWQSQKASFYKHIKEDVEYVIYLYILDHLRRIHFDKYGYNNKIYIGYNFNENGELVENNGFSINFHRSHLVSKFFKDVIFPHFTLNKKNDDQNFDLLKAHFIQTKKEINKRYPNAKMIIIKHPDGLKGIHPKDRYSLGYSYTTERWNELEKEGIIVYDLKTKLNIDITEDEYTLPDGHPNEKTWDIVSKKLIKDFNL